MPRLDLKAKSQPEIDYRRAILSLRWLLVILASYLTVFGYIGTPLFPVAAAASLAFALTNVMIVLIPRGRFIENYVQRAVGVLDVIFVSATLYLLREPNNYLYAAFIAIFMLAAIWRDLRLVLFSLLSVSLLYGTFIYFRIFQFELDVNIERFLTLALFFVVSMFYVFLSDRLTQDAKLSNLMIEENRVAEAMVEMTRILSSSLNTDKVLSSFVARLREVIDAEECAIVRIDSKSGAARLLMRASQPDERDVAIDLDQYPELKQACASRQLLFAPDAKPTGLLAVPMVINESALGLIVVYSNRLRPIMTEANARFFEVMGSTAANALHNAQLYEEVEQRARTDFLTGLPNQRDFQATLSIELSRAHRHNRTLSLLMIDLDFLKEVNDRFGHPRGDEVIKRIAGTIRHTCRETDFPARYGGEEFAVILPETPLSGGIEVAERLRRNIAAEDFADIGQVTASIGVSAYPVNALTKVDLIRAADQALYNAKNGGRDRVAYFEAQLVVR
jgi:diguanylate cyclase (GGDEF)-like protein